MADILVTNPFYPFTLPTQFKAVFNGYVYCGTVDAVDPSVSQVQVYLINEAGDKVPVAQPLRTNAGGYLVYNGQPAKFVTDSNHSLLVQDQQQVQVWYAPNMATIDPSTAFQFVITQTREALRRSYSEAGYFLVDGSFEDGGVVGLTNDVLLFEADGKSYSWGGVLPKNVPSGSTPATSGGIGEDEWTLVSLPSTLFDPATSLTTMTLPELTFTLDSHQLTGSSLVGQGLNSKLKAADGAETVLRLGHEGGGASWYLRGLDKLAIDGNNRLSKGLMYAHSGDIDNPFAGRWDIGNVLVENCDIGIHKPTGNIGNVYRSVRVKDNNIGYKAFGQELPVIMHAGCDVFQGGQFGGNSYAAAVIDSPVSGTGQTVFRDVIFEANPGFGVFVKNWFAGMTPFAIDNCWFEGNATAGSVTIDSVAYAPRDVRIDNTDFGIVRSCFTPKIEVNNSAVKIENAYFDDTCQTFIDTSSAVSVTDAHINGGTHKVVVTSLAAGKRPLGGTASLFWAPPRIKLSYNTVGFPVLGQTYNGESTYSFPGTTTETGRKYPDGRIFDASCELTIPAGGTNLGDTFFVTAGLYYVMTMDVKYVAGDIDGLTIKFVDSGAFCGNFNTLLRGEEWVTVACVGKANSNFSARLWLQSHAAGSQKLRLSALQVVEFARYDDAIQFYNSRDFAGSASLPRETYGTATPTIGVWKKGDRIINSSPAASGIYGWVCTTAGDAATTAVFKPISTIGA